MVSDIFEDEEMALFGIVCNSEEFVLYFRKASSYVKRKKNPFFTVIRGNQ